MNDIDTEQLDAQQMWALLDTAPSIRNPIVFQILRNGARKRVAIPVKKVEQDKVELQVPFRNSFRQSRGSITLEAETGFATTPTLSHSKTTTLSHSQTPVGANSEAKQEGERSHLSAGSSVSGDGILRMSIIHEGFGTSLISIARSVTSPRTLRAPRLIALVPWLLNCICIFDRHVISCM